MTRKIFFFESHPVQYKAPVYQALNEILRGRFEVVYATDASMKAGHVDTEFGVEVAWDTPLLQGYPFRVLGNERGVALSSPSSLSGRGIFSMLIRERPAAVVLTQMRFRFDQAAFLSAMALGIPILIRQETQDEMFAGRRSPIKELTRAVVYRLLYSRVRHAFAFGKLNYAHLIRHGIRPSNISFAHFSVPNPIEPLSDVERLAFREQVRTTIGASDDAIVVGFFGKLIPKKNPDLLFDALEHLPAKLRSRLHMMFVGSGELLSPLMARAADAEARWGVHASFVGFVNQSKLPPYYLATDILVLPSRRMGEAWGLVVNEALHAGCSVVVTDAVGCHPEFGHLDRVRVIPVERSTALAEALQSLSSHARGFHWAEDHMREYSTFAAAMDVKSGLEPYLGQMQK